MSCRQTDLLKRLSVGDQAALETEPWQRHLRKCGHCRAELSAEERALALFRQVEGEDREQALAPSWETFAATLQVETRRVRLRRALRVSAVAAVTLAAGITGTMSLWESRQPSPAQIVRLQPVQQAVLEDAMRDSLSNSRVEFVVDRADRLPIAARRTGKPAQQPNTFVLRSEPLEGRTVSSQSLAGTHEGFFPRSDVSFFGPQLRSTASPLVTPVSHRASFAPIVAGR